MKRTIIITLIMSLLWSCYNREKPIDKSTLNGYDFRLFQNTPAWELAKAVEDEDTELIRKIGNKGLINYQESRFGNSLLMLAVSNRLYSSVKTLLELGGDPNLHDNYKGTNSVIRAAYCESKDSLIMMELLKYGGNPNSFENKPQKNDSTYEDERESALIAASKNNLTIAKLLVEGGANVNLKGLPDNNGPFENSLIQGEFDIAYYLLQNGAEYTNRVQMITQSVDVLYLLRMSVNNLNTIEYAEKMKVVSFLQSKGIDYWSYPIPESVVEEVKRSNPNDWQDFLKKY